MESDLFYTLLKLGYTNKSWGSTFFTITSYGNDRFHCD